jgi:hypothetical protein
VTEQEKMSLDEAEELLNNFMRDAIPRHSGVPKTEELMARLDAVEERREIEKRRAEAPTFSEEPSEALPALRDATSALARLDESAQRAKRLAKAAEGMAWVVGSRSSFKGDGPAYMNAAVRALREETRAYETAIKLAQVLATGGGYRVAKLRNESWAKEDE